MSARATPIDQPVRERIRTELGTNLCVEAGAGTGKTTSLVARIVELLAGGEADADGLVVITFTEKAAAELSARVREAIERGMATEQDAGRRERLEHAARALYRARIETIHTFAADILRERPVEAGIDPGFGVLRDLEAELSFDEAYQAWLDALMEADHPELRRALNVGFGLAEIRETAEVVNRYRFLLPLAPFPEPTPDADGLISWVEANMTELEQIREECRDETDKGPAEIDKLARFAERCAAEGGSPADRERLAARAAPKVAKGAGRKASWDDPGRCKRMKELFAEYGDLRERTQEELGAAALLAVLPHVERFVRGYESARRRTGVADFDDLLIWTRDLLRDNLEVRGYFRDRFSTLLIDEFQDTDPIQVEIATYLTASDASGEDWRSLEPEPGRLFVVGDPKQSIYRFRRADIAIYDEVKRRLLGDGLVQIVQNFRSLPGVLAWINRVFDALFEEQEGIQPANVALEAVDREPSVERPPVVVVRHIAEDANAEQLRALEAGAVASLLREAVVDAPWPVRDQATGGLRPATPRDVAILLPARTGLDAYEEALAGAGVPYRHEGSRDYFRRQEVRDLISVLRAIDDPGDHLSVFGALRSGAFGCSDGDVVTHRATGGAWDYRVAEASSASEPVMEALGVLRELHYGRGRQSLAELVQKVVEQSRLVDFALTQTDGPQAAANLLAIVDQARAFSAAGGGGLRAFCRWLVQSTDNEAQEVDAGISEETDDVVRLLTMHGAKGLEFGIVVLANLSGSGQNQTEPVPDEPAGRLHLRVGTKSRSGHFRTPGFAERWEGEKEALAAERIRLLYVAATRARDHLIVPHVRSAGGKPGPSLRVLEPLLPALDTEGHDVDVDGVRLLDATRLAEARDPERAVPAPDAGEVERALALREEWVVDQGSVVREARRELPFVVASSVERSTRPLAAEASHSAQALLVSEGPPLPVGDALHLVMERVALPDAEDLVEVVEAVCAEAGLLDRLEEVREMAERCLASPVVRRAVESGSAQREVPFTVVGEGGFATGRVDLVFGENDGLVVVDYKTDAVAANDAERHAVEHHGGQADVYARAIAHASGRSVDRVVFVYCRSGVEVAVSDHR